MFLFLLQLFAFEAVSLASTWFSRDHDNYNTKFSSSTSKQYVSPTNWTTPVGEFTSNPVIDSMGNIVFLTQPTYNKFALEAYNTKGVKIWEWVAPFTTTDNYGIVIDITDTIYLSGDSDQISGFAIVYAVSSSDGKAMNAFHVEGRINSIVVLADFSKYVLLHEDSTLIRVSSDNQIKWQFSLLGKGTGACMSSFFNDAFTGGLFFCSNSTIRTQPAPFLVSLSLDPTGEKPPTINWKADLGGSAIIKAAYLPAMNAFVVNGLNAMMKGQFSSTVLITLEGKIIWVAKVPKYCCFSVGCTVNPVTNTIVYACCSAYISVNGSTGEWMWSGGPDNGSTVNPTISIRAPWTGNGSGLIAVAGVPQDGYLYGLNPKDGTTAFAIHVVTPGEENIIWVFQAAENIYVLWIDGGPKLGRHLSSYHVPTLQ